MNYATIDDVKNVLNKETLTSFETTRINGFLNYTTSYINNMIGDVTSSDKTEQINYCDVCNGSFILKNINVTDIKSINGTNYTGTLGSDYIIEHGRKVIMNDLNTYLSNNSGYNKFGYFTITYTSGYSTIPNDLVLLQASMVSELMSAENGKDISSYKVGDVSVTFSENKTYYNSILNKYKTF